MTRLEAGRVNGPLTVSDDLVLTGLATHPITVLAGGDLQLSGMAAAGLDVQTGGRARVSGMLQGTLTCAGDVELTGLLAGTIVVEPGGRLLVAEGAGRRRTHGPDLVMGHGGRWQARDRETYVIDDSTPRWLVQSD